MIIDPPIRITLPSGCYEVARCDGFDDGRRSIEAALGYRPPSPPKLRVGLTNRLGIRFWGDDAIEARRQIEAATGREIEVYT